MFGLEDAARLNSSGSAAPCVQVPVMVFRVRRDFAFVDAVDHFYSQLELGIFEGDGTDGDAIPSRLVNAVERGLEAVVGRFGDVQDEAELLAARAESALPVAGDVLRARDGRGQKYECWDNHESLHHFLRNFAFFVSDSVFANILFGGVAGFVLGAFELQRNPRRSLVPVARHGLKVLVDLALEIATDLFHLDLDR